jgi:signal transduction histidine kinase/ActR/RegA family two-component response regulator
MDADERDRRAQISEELSKLLPDSIAAEVTHRFRMMERDREELLASERAARSEAERANRMKDEFLATLSHELRTPLNAIVGWAQMLKGGRLDPASADRGIEVIDRNARLLSQLVSDLLDMSRITSGKLRLDVQPVDPWAVIEAAIESVQRAADAKGIVIFRRLGGPCEPLLADPGRIQQVVWNLLSNAIKFTPRGGRVEVALECGDASLEISVSDTGCGIRPEFLPHLFGRFRQADPATTRHHGGLGLGLSICRHLVELHGGTVRASSAGEGQGATFTVTLPTAALREAPAEVTPTAPRASPPPAPFEATSLAGLRILVVDDEPDARDLVQRILGEYGAEILVAGSAAEAMELFLKRPPDVLVSDIGMPDVDGYDLIRRVRALPPDEGGAVAAVALTAFARPEDRARAERAGYQAHVSKPVEGTELCATIARAAGIRGAQATAP